MKVAALLGGMALMAVLAVFPQEKAEAQRPIQIEPSNICKFDGEICYLDVMGCVCAF